MIHAIIVGDAPVRLWGLTGRQRLERQIGALRDVRLLADEAGLPARGRVLLVRGDFLFEQRALAELLAREGALWVHGVPAAVLVPAQRAGEALAALRQGRTAALPALHPHDLQAFEGDLRKSAPPLVAAIDAGRRDELETRLYGAAYKGITDFVTKWWWPRPAKAGVRMFAGAGITPNMVTATGFLLMLATCWLFYEGQYAAGLLLGWLMTYLDTVDGKLARVTAQSSRVGHLLDHGMDLLHPPFWYLLWGMSLEAFEPLAGIGQAGLYLAIFAGYIGGRIVEGVFDLLGETSIFAWRPFDAYFRLYTARRNPCLVLLTVAWALGSPALGLWLVAGWTALSTLVLVARLAYALRVRAVEGRLRSWLADPDAAQRYPRAYAEFAATRQAGAGA